jgi:hypothetical protein
LLLLQLNFFTSDELFGVFNGVIVSDPAAPTLSLRVKGFGNLGAYNSPSDFCFSNG